VVVASERTDEPAEGTLVLEAPAGWQVTPHERPYRLAPGAHVPFDAEVHPAPGAADGRYFVAARIEDGGQAHEDVVRIDLDRERSSGGQGRSPADRSQVLTQAIRRSLTTAGLEPTDPAMETDDAVDFQELLVELTDRAVQVRSGQRQRLRVSIRNCAGSEIRGEAQLLSPHETWSFLRPWTQGFAVAPGDSAEVEFVAEPVVGTPSGTWWALVKVMAFGRLYYTDSVPIEVVG
jgi:hypothetical protein